MGSNGSPGPAPAPEVEPPSRFGMPASSDKTLVERAMTLEREKAMKLESETAVRSSSQPRPAGQQGAARGASPRSTSRPRSAPKPPPPVLNPEERKKKGFLPSKSQNARAARGPIRLPFEEEPEVNAQATPKTFYDRAYEALQYTAGETNLANDILQDKTNFRRDGYPDPLAAADRFGENRAIDMKLLKSRLQAQLGGHYEYVVAPLPAAKAMESLDQKAHDEGAAEMLHPHNLERTPSRPPRRSLTPKRSSTPPRCGPVAFPDRSCRLREGLGAKAAMMRGADEATPREPSEASDTTAAEARAVFAMHAAGQPAHLVSYNKPPPCAEDCPPRTQTSENYNSRHIVATFMSQAAADHQEQVNPPPEDAEADFRKNLIRKVRDRGHSPGGGVALPHRGGRQIDVDGASFASTGAGNFNRDSHENPHKGRQVFQSKAGETPPRSGAAFVMQPDENDPPIPRQICASRKGIGSFSYGCTEETEQRAIEANPQMLRYEHKVFYPRRPERSISPEASGAAGVTSETAHGAPFLFHRTGGDDELYRARAANRYSSSNRSCSLRHVTNQRCVAEENARERSTRLASDRSFAALCQATIENSRAMKEQVDDFSERIHRTNSANVASILQWDP